jgi:hypothetical protein
MHADVSRHSREGITNRSRSASSKRFPVQTTQVGHAYPPALAVTDSFDTTEAVISLSALTELEELIDRELNYGASNPACDDFPVSEDRIEQEAEQLRQRELSSELASWVDSYGQVGGRTPYLWTWCRQGAEATTLPCVSATMHDELCDTKVIGMMFDVLLDDIADQGGDAELLEQLVGLPLSDNPSEWRDFTNEEQRYAAFSELVWNEVQHRVERFPRYDEFADLLRYDYLQLMNTMRYAHLLNRFPSLLNLAEHDLYLPHNMMMMICATMDLMCSPEFDFSEIGHLRQATWHAQHMGRIGNLITTWKREIHEADFTSGVFAHAVIFGDLSLEQLANGDCQLIEQAIRDGRHEEYFVKQWRKHREHLLALQPSVRSVDLRGVVHGLDRLICLHLASRGLK